MIRVTFATLTSLTKKQQAHQGTWHCKGQNRWPILPPLSHHLLFIPTSFRGSREELWFLHISSVFGSKTDTRSNSRQWLQCKFWKGVIRWEEWAVFVKYTKTQGFQYTKIWGLERSSQQQVSVRFLLHWCQESVVIRTGKTSAHYCKHGIFIWGKVQYNQK